MTTIFGGDLRRKVGEFLGKKSRVVRDHDLRRFVDLISRVPLLDIRHQSLRRATSVVRIHRVRSDAWKLWSLIKCCSAAFRYGHNFTDGAAAQSAGAEFQRFIK